MSVLEWFGLGKTKSSADYYRPDPRGYTWGIDPEIARRDTDVTYRQAQDDYAAQQAARAQQMALAQQLQAQAMGQGPSLANMQLQEALARSNAQSMSMAASAAPNQSALAYRAAIQSNAQAAQQAAATGAQARVAEQLAAQRQLADLLGQTRQQDLGSRSQSWDAYSGIRQAELGASMDYQDAMQSQARDRASAYNQEQKKRADAWGAAISTGAKLAMGVF